MRFIKMHGLGNDYVYVNAMPGGETVPSADESLSDLARVVSDRHFGVGGDGLIVVAPPTADGRAEGAVVRMRMFNADGSESEMCGNGVRCVCKLAYDHEVVAGIRERNPMRVETGRGVLSLRYHLGPDGRVASVTVDMGAPILEPRQVPVDLPGPAVERVAGYATDGLIDWPRGGDGDWMAAAGLDTRMTCVSMGNPHAVFFVADAGRVPLERVGPVIERHRLFPRRINVHFVRVHSDVEVTMRTWERGSGVTLACGTGASAVCVAGVLTGRTGRSIRAHLPGGDLDLQWQEETNRVLMTGPATEVFEGSFRFAI